MARALRVRHDEGVLFLLIAAAPDAFAIAMAEARASARKAEWEVAIAHLARAKEAAGEPVEGGPRCALAELEQGEIELERRRFRDAIAHYQKGGLLALDDRALRARALGRRANAARRAGMGGELERTQRLEAADRAVARRANVPSLEVAARAYTADGDAVRASWARALAASILVNGRPKELAAGKALAAELSKGTPPFVRAVALQAGLRAAQREKDLEAETSYALQLDAVRFRTFAPEKRRYLRSGPAQSACARYERSAGAGACAALAKRATGEYTFADHSRLRRKKLSASDIAAAQAQYLPLIEYCLRTAAKDEKNAASFDDATINLSWSIDRSGRATSLQIAPKRYDTLAGECLRNYLGWFRYPRHQDPDLPNVTLPFRVNGA